MHDANAVPAAPVPAPADPLALLAAPAPGPAYALGMPAATAPAPARRTLLFDAVRLADGTYIPTSTFASEVIRLEYQARERPYRDPNWCTIRCRRNVRDTYGKTCYECGHQIVLVFDTEPLLRKLDVDDEPLDGETSWFHVACWKEYQREKRIKRRRLSGVAREHEDAPVQQQLAIVDAQILQ